MGPDLLNAAVGTSHYAPPKEGDECTICLDKFSTSDGRTVMVTACKHAYHEDCILQWQRRAGFDNENCPICRRDIEPLEIVQVEKNTVNTVSVSENHLISCRSVVNDYFLHLASNKTNPHPLRTIGMPMGDTGGQLAGASRLSNRLPNASEDPHQLRSVSRLGDTGGQLAGANRLSNRLLNASVDPPLLPDVSRLGDTDGQLAGANSLSDRLLNFSSASVDPHLLRAVSRLMGGTGGQRAGANSRA